VSDPVNRDGGQVSSGKTLEVRGVGTPGNTIEVSVDGVVVGTTQVNAQGFWRFSLPRLTVGSRSVTAVTIDSNGVRSEPSPPIALTVLESAALDFSGVGDTAVTGWRWDNGAVRFKIRRASGERWITRQIAGQYPVAGDYDGDGMADVAAVERAGGGLLWNIRSSISGTLSTTKLGEVGDTILGGCKLQSSDRVSLAVFRQKLRQIIVRDINQTREQVRQLRGLPQGDLLGCGDTDADGVDEVIFKVPGTSGSDAIAAFDTSGQRVVEKDLTQFLRGLVVRRAGTEVPLLAIVQATTRKGIPIRVETLAGSFSFPMFYVGANSTIGTGFFSSPSGQQNAGLLWSENRTRTIYRRLLKRGSDVERLFKLPHGYNLLRTQNLFKTAAQK
jgi:hypothetical protein